MSYKWNSCLKNIKNVVKLIFIRDFWRKKLHKAKKRIFARSFYYFKWCNRSFLARICFDVRKVSLAYARLFISKMRHRTAQVCECERMNAVSEWFFSRYMPSLFPKPTCRWPISFNPHSLSHSCRVRNFAFIICTVHT